MVRLRVKEQGAHLVIGLIIILVIGLIGTLAFIFLNNLTRSSDDSKQVSSTQGALLGEVVSCEPSNNASVVTLDNEDKYCLKLDLPEGWSIDDGYEAAQYSLDPAPAKTISGVKYYVEFRLSDSDLPTNYGVTSEHVEITDSLMMKNGKINIVKWKDNFQYVVSTCEDNPDRPERKSEPDENGVHLSVSEYGCYPSVSMQSHPSQTQSTNQYLSITLQRVTIDSGSTISDLPYPPAIVEQFISIVASLENK